MTDFWPEIHYKRTCLTFVVFFFLLSFWPQNSYIYAQEPNDLAQIIIGEISGQPGFEFVNPKKEVLVLPTSSGLYLIYEGRVVKRFLAGMEISSYKMIADQDSDGEKDLVIGFEDHYFTCFKCVSSNTGKALWQFFPENKMLLGESITSPSNSPVMVYSAQENQYLYLTAGCTVYKVSLQNGMAVWKHSEARNIVSLTVIPDLDGDNLEDLCVDNELGVSTAISAAKGKAVWYKKRQETITGSNQLADSKGNVLLTDSGTAIALLDKKTKSEIWSIQRFYDAGFLHEEDEKDYLLLYSVSTKDHSGEKTGLIRKVSEQQVIWEYMLNKSDILKYGGMGKVQFGADFNGDGVTDILAALAPQNSGSKLPVKIFALSGSNGKLLWETYLSADEKIVSILRLEDLNNDGACEIMAGTSTHFYILDGAGGHIIKSWPHFNLKMDGYFEPTKGIAAEAMLLSAGDVNKDGVSDLFILTPTQVRLGLTNRVGGIDFYYRELYKIPAGEIDLSQATLFDDLDQDGIAELNLTRKVGKQTVQSIISGNNGRLLMEQEGEQLVLHGSGVDFNDNGTKDLILCKDDGPNGRQLQIVDGKDGSVLWNYPSFGCDQLFSWSNDNIPVCAVDDLNNDGIPELAVLKNAGAGTGLKIEIFDVAGGWEQPYKVLNIQELPAGELNQNWSAGFSMQTLLLYRTKCLAATAKARGENGETMVVIYDYLAAKPVAFLPTSNYKMALAGTNSLIVEDEKGKVNYFKIIPGNISIRIANGEEGSYSSLSSPLKIQWSNDQSSVITSIFADNVLALETADELAEIEVNGGSHIIGVAQYLPNGEYSLQNISVMVVGNNNPLIIAAGISFFWIGIIFGFPIFLKRYFRSR